MDLMTRYRAMAGVKKGEGGLPAGYTAVDEFYNYTANGGTFSYFDTNVSATNGWACEFDFKAPTLPNRTGIIGISGYQLELYNWGGMRFSFAINGSPVIGGTQVLCQENTWYHIKFNIANGNCFIYVDDTLVLSSATTVGTLSGNIRLFLNMKCHIKNLVIYEPSFETNVMPTVPIADFKYCYRDSDYILCIYEAVSKTMTVGVKYNSELDFRFGEEITDNSLPNEYQRLSYLQSNGAQVIDLGIKAQDLYGFKYSFKPIYFNGKWFGTGRFGLTGSFNSSNTISALFNARNNWYMVGRTISTDNFITAQVINGVFSCDGYNNNIGNTPLDNNASSPNIALFSDGLATAGGAGGMGGTFEVYDDNGDFVGEIVPCYRKSDIKGGYYDKINNVFISNIC